MEKFDRDLRSLQQARDLARAGAQAAKEFSTYSEEQVDLILKNMVRVAEANKVMLAEMAHKETGYGNVYDKIYKYTDLSDKNDIKKIEKLLFKYLDSNSSVEELNIDFDINADTSEIDDIMSNSYEDVWGDVIDLEDDFSIDDILDMPIITEFKSVPCKGCQ